MINTGHRGFVNNFVTVNVTIYMKWMIIETLWMTSIEVNEIKYLNRQIGFTKQTFWHIDCIDVSLRKTLGLDYFMNEFYQTIREQIN